MRSRESFDYGYRPRVTVLVPCRNEELVVEGLVTCLAGARLPGRSARARRDRRRLRRRHGAILDELARRDRRLHVIHRPRGRRGGKSGALNCRARDRDRRGHRRVRRRPQAAGPTCCAGSCATSPTREVGAVQGRCIVRNSEESSLAKTIAVDYYCGYLVNEYGRQSLYDLPAYGGANCAVRASVAARVRRLERGHRHRGHRPHAASRARGPARPLRRHRDRHRGERVRRSGASGASATAGRAVTSRRGASTAARSGGPRT